MKLANIGKGANQAAEPNQKTWNFPKAFWTANIVELFERAAYYAVFIAVTLYLTQVVGFNDIWAAWIGGIFSAGLYLLPAFTGAYADRIGFRNAVILAFTLLTIGYFTLGALPYKITVMPAILIIMIGGSFIKSIITGTVAKTSTSETRARAFSLFYMIVNIGAFLGKTFAYPLRLEWGLVSINYYAAAMTLLALITVFFFYKNVNTGDERKDINEIIRSFIKVVTNIRLLILILIVAGFWLIYYQLYATMPKYVLRLVGEHAAPEWIANVNPMVVMSTVVFITHIMSKVKAITSMSIGMFIMPVSALCMASSKILQNSFGDQVSILGLFSVHPVILMMIVGIIFQGLAESFISPRYLEFFSHQAPKGEEGMYMGFAQVHSFFASILGFGISGYLLTAYAPDPTTLTPEQMKTAYDHAHYIWFYFAGIGVISGIALLVYNIVVNRIDRKTQLLADDTD